MTPMRKKKKRFVSQYLIYLAPVLGGLFFIFFGSNIISKNFEPFKYIYIAPEKRDDDTNRQKEISRPFHLSTPNPVRGIYMSSWVASTRDWRNSLVKMIEETELNTVVIDVKDYTGRIAFEVSDSELVKTGSIDNRIDDIKDFINSLHDKNIYVIARIAVFQDPYFVKQRPDLAVKTKSGAVWKDKKGLTWIDPCAKEYWDYTVRIAKEVEKTGFDELNFDYIRFASDGNMTDIIYPLCEADITKADALEEFFKYLSENLKDVEVPISADLFGMITTNYDDMNIGQVLEKTAPYFDYICPMVYPSHYPATYNGFRNPAEYPYEVIKLAMDTAIQRLVNQQIDLLPNATSTPPTSIPISDFQLLTSKIRPWLQDFDLGADYTAEMVRKEKQAVYDAGIKSWLLWDPANKYTRSALD